MHDPAPHWRQPEHMTPREQRDELAAILSAGLMRLSAQQSSTLSAPSPDSLVDFSAVKSGVHRRRLRNRVGG
jgi:hypothetical protein